MVWDLKHQETWLGSHGGPHARTEKDMLYESAGRPLVNEPTPHTPRTRAQSTWWCPMDVPNSCQRVQSVRARYPRR